MDQTTTFPLTHVLVSRTFTLNKTHAHEPYQYGCSAARTALYSSTSLVLFKQIFTVHDGDVANTVPVPPYSAGHNTASSSWALDGSHHSKCLRPRITHADLRLALQALYCRNLGLKACACSPPYSALRSATTVNYRTLFIRKRNFHTE